MAARIDHVEIKLDVFREFEGRQDVEIVFVPTEADDPLLKLILEKWHGQDEQRRLIAVKNGAGDLFIG
jgi:hypothetical protein